MELKSFLNDKYILLKLLYDNQTMVLNKKVVPLTQSEISDVLGMSKAKVNYLIGELQEKKYITLESRGKYSILTKGLVLIEEINQIEEKIHKCN